MILQMDRVWSKVSEYLIIIAQRKWLAKDLEGVNRTLTPWVIVMGHRPMYTGKFCHKNYIEGMLVTGPTYRVSLHIQEELEDLLYQFKVNLALWGHVHNYGEKILRKLI